MAGKKATKIDREIGKRIRTARIKAGLTNYVLARMLSMTYQGYDGYEAGRTKTPAAALYQIAKITEMPVGYFYGEQ